MASFERGQTLKTREPTITVDAGLPVGTHRFALQVTTASGARSATDVVQVSVVRGTQFDPDRPLRPVGPVTRPVSPVIRRSS